MVFELPSGRTNVDLDIIFEFDGPNGPRFLVDGNVKNMAIVPGLVEIRQATIQAFVEPASLRLYMNMEGDVNLLGANIKGAFRFDVDESGVYELSASLNANVNWDVVGVDGRFDFLYRRGGFPSMNFAGTVNVAGQKMLQASGRLDEYNFTLSARADVGNIFKGELIGQIVFCNPGGSQNILIPNRDGVMVTAQPGDFYFSASAALDFGIASGTGALKVGQSAVSTQQPQLTACPTYSPLPNRTLNVEAIAAASRSSIPGASTTTTGLATTTTARAATTSVAPVTTVAPSSTRVVAAAVTTIAPSTTVAPVVTQRDLSAQEIASLVSRQANAAEASNAPATSTTVATTPVSLPVVQSTKFAAPRVPRVSFAKINANGQLALTPISGAVNFNGDIDSTGRLVARITGTLAMGALANAAIDAGISIAPNGDWTMNANFVGKVAGDLATVNFTGAISEQHTFVPAQPARAASTYRACNFFCPVVTIAARPAIPESYTSNGVRYRFTGAAAIVVPGVNTNGNFTFSNYPEDSGLRATANLVAGPDFARVTGSLSIAMDAEGKGFLATGNGSAAISGISNAYAQFHVLNVTPRFMDPRYPQTVCSDQAKIQIGTTAYCPVTKEFAFSTWFGIFGLSFALNGKVNTNGTFRFEANSPAGGGIATKTLYLGCWWGNLYLDINYRVGVIVQSGQPNLAVNGSGGLKLRHYSWWPGSYSDRTIASANFRGTVNPTSLIADINVNFVINVRMSVAL
jgi:hypothetical protein